MSEMVERVARALATQREQNGGPPIEAYGKHALQGLYEDARAAIAAMREPTGAMLSAAQRRVLSCGYGHEAEDFRIISSAMIDAALRD